MADTPKRKRLEKTTEPQPLGNQKYICFRCGISYSRQKGFFPVSHSPMYRGVGYMPTCVDCIDVMFDQYRVKLGSDRSAMKRLCMKMDLYWNDSIYDMVERSSAGSSIPRNYIGKTNLIRYIDKTYDDTLVEEAKASADVKTDLLDVFLPDEDDQIETDSGEEIVIPDDVALFWGPGYTPQMYLELEGRRKYWISRYPDGYIFDIGEEALIRQICNLEIDINHDRAAGKSIDKNVNTLNSLLGSANLKPTQKKTEEADAEYDSTPLGVWIKRWENTRPIPEPDPELQDVDGIIRYIEIWFKGHLAKMVGLKNSYSKMYEDEIAKMRVERTLPEEEDDETVFNDIFATYDE